MPAAYAYRFTRSADGYAVGYLPTLDSIAAGEADRDSGRHLGTVRRLSQEWQSLSPKWQATAPDGTNLGTHYRTRAEAAQALLVTADRLAQVEAIADAAEPVDAEVEELLDTVEAHADAEHAADEEQRALDAGDGLVHLMSHDLLDACGTAAPGGLHLAPSTTPERITCPACLPLVEADVPSTAEERVTVTIRASELRPGDEVVDSLGNRQYAAFDVQVGHALASFAPVVRVWTAVRDQEAGLPPVITVPAGRELLVLRPLSEEGRELLAALDRS